MALVKKTIQKKQKRKKKREIVKVRQKLNKKNQAINQIRKKVILNNKKQHILKIISKRKVEKILNNNFKICIQNLKKNTGQFKLQTTHLKKKIKIIKEIKAVKG